MPGDYLSVDETRNGNDDIMAQLDELGKEEDVWFRKGEGKPRKKGHKRRRRDSNISMACPTAFATPPFTVAFPEGRFMRLDLPGEDMNAAYSAWHQGRLVNEEAREHYAKVQRLLTDKCVELDMVTYNKGMTFDLCLRNNVPEGIAWRWISDIQEYLDYRVIDKSMQGN